MKIRPVGAELFHAQRRTDGRTAMTKLMFAFRDIANAPKNEAPIPLPYAAIYGTNLH